VFLFVGKKIRRLYSLDRKADGLRPDHLVRSEQNPLSKACLDQPTELSVKVLELAAIEGEDDHSPLGEVPVEWLQRRILGVATTGGDYADICSSEWISRLRKSLATHLSRFGVQDIDASVLQKTAPRILTQFVSRIVFYAGFSGIYYLSKYGHDIENWALFETVSNQRERSRNGFSRGPRIATSASTSLLEVARIASTVGVIELLFRPFHPKEVAGQTSSSVIQAVRPPHHWCANGISKPISRVEACGFLQHLSHGRGRRRFFRGETQTGRQRQVNINSCARNSQLEFHRVTALQYPGSVIRMKKPGKNPVESHLAAQARETDLLCVRGLAESILERPSTAPAEAYFFGGVIESRAVAQPRRAFELSLSSFQSLSVSD